MGTGHELLPPLLWTLHGCGGSVQQSSYYNLLKNRHQTTSFTILGDRRVLGSAYGWLVLVDLSDGDCCLWNPTSQEIIQLQELEDPLTYNKCFLSKPPTEPGCFIVFNQYYFMTQCFCKIVDGIANGFKYITSKEAAGYTILDMVYFRGVVYGLVNPGFKFVTFDMDHGDVYFRIDTLLVDGKRPLKVPRPTRSWATTDAYYLMESPCGNELLLVTRMCFTWYHRNVVQFRVFRVDVKRMECEELRNLDGRTIFINYYGNGFCRCSSESTGIKPNSIYYTSERSGRIMYVYDLDDRSSVSLLPCPDAGVDLNTSENYWVDLPHSLGFV